MPKSINKYLLAAEASKFLGINKQTLKRWGDTGKIEYFLNPINGWRLYSLENLEKILKAIK